MLCVQWPVLLQYETIFMQLSLLLLVQARLVTAVCCAAFGNGLGLELLNLTKIGCQPINPSLIIKYGHMYSKPQLNRFTVYEHAWSP